MSRFLDSFLSATQERLAQLKAQDLHRTLQLPAGTDFASNDYLGLNSDPAFLRRLLERLQAAAGTSGTESSVGAPASRLLRGNTAQHRAVERKLAAFKGAEDALLFPSGYQANLAVLSTLVGPRDRVLSDEQNHASIIDALRLSRAQKVIFTHVDAAAAERAAAEPFRGGRTFLVTESLFSMDGDVAPLEEYARLCERYDMGLIVDEAHATGCFGKKRGAGLLEEYGLESEALVTISTFGKALGLAGAWVSAHKPTVEYLINCARPFVFSTAPPPLLLHAFELALELVTEQPQRRLRVLSLADRLRARLRDAGLDCLRSCGPIVPVILGDNRLTLEVAQELQSNGLDVRAIRPPSVAPGTARLRVSVHASHTEADVDRLAATLVRALTAPAPPQ